MSSEPAWWDKFYKPLLSTKKQPKAAGFSRSVMEEERLAYDAEWRDERRDGFVTHLKLIIFPSTDEVELIDAKSRKSFLRRCQPDGPRIVPELLRPGASVTILSRQLKILGYADEHTRSRLQPKQERTLALLTGSAVRHWGEIVQLIYDRGLLIGELRMFRLGPETAKLAQGAPSSLQQSLASAQQQADRFIAMELLGAGAVDRWQQLLSSPAADLGASTGPRLAAICHASQSAAAADQECDFLLGREVGQLGAPSGAGTLCLVKPHAILQRGLGSVLSALSADFAITAAASRRFSSGEAALLLETFHNVLEGSVVHAMHDELCSGTCVALEVSSLAGPEAPPPVEALRQLCGPLDPVLAKALRPHSLRARLGESKALNGVHCTELAEETSRDLAAAFGSPQGV